MLVVSSGVVFAQCGGDSKAGMGLPGKMITSGSEEEKANDTQKKGMSDGEVTNKVCPVLEGKVDKDTPYTAEYQGKKIGLCCAECAEKFKADPGRYMEKFAV